MDPSANLLGPATSLGRAFFAPQGAEVPLAAVDEPIVPIGTAKPAEMLVPSIL